MPLISWSFTHITSFVVDFYPLSVQLPVPNDGPAGRDAAHCGAALWVGAFLHLNLNIFYFFQCYFFFFFVPKFFNLYSLHLLWCTTGHKNRVFMPICVPFPEPHDPILGFLSRFCRLQGDEHGAFCQQRVILARTFSTSHSWERNTLFCTGTNLVLCCQQNRSATLYRHQRQRPS